MNRRCWLSSSASTTRPRFEGTPSSRTRAVKAIDKTIRRPARQMSEPNDSLYRGLQSAFNAEAANVQRYAFFAQIAEIGGHGDTSRLFQELADSLAVAAQGHMDHLRNVADPATRLPIGGTEQNLAAALAGEL